MRANYPWPRHLFGRNPQSVGDSGGHIRHDDISQTDATPVDLKLLASLPIDVSGCTGFHDLPDELLENIFQQLEGTSRRNLFAV